MSWKTVKSNKYYYKNHKHDRKVCTSYFGRGSLAEAVAWLDARERERRLERREQHRAQRDRLAAIEAAVVEYYRRIDELFAGLMRINDWHLRRGEWRRNGKVTRRSMRKLPNMDKLFEAENVRREFEAGNVAELIKRYRGDMAANAIEAIVSRATDDPAQREALRRQAVKLREDLAGPAATPIERILAERVAVSHLDSYYSDILAQSDSFMQLGDFLQRRQDRAHRRYLQAVKTLALCRKLETTTIREAVDRLQLVS
jgi:hypothetical protein